MTQRQFASVLFAVVGVFMAVSWLPQVVIVIGLFIQQMATSADHQENVGYAITSLIGSIVAVLLGIGLMVKRDRLADRLFAADTGPLVARDTQAVALSVLGCYFAIGALPRLLTVAPFGVRRSDWEAVA